MQFLEIEKTQKQVRDVYSLDLLLDIWSDFHPRWYRLLRWRVCSVPDGDRLQDRCRCEKKIVENAQITKTAKKLLFHSKSVEAKIAKIVENPQIVKKYVYITAK